VSRGAGLEFDDGDAQCCEDVDLDVLAKPLSIFFDDFYIDLLVVRRSYVDRCGFRVKALLGSIRCWRKDGGWIFQKLMEVIVVEEVDNIGTSLTLARNIR
jgi:hypothetical protein